MRGLRRFAPVLLAAMLWFLLLSGCSGSSVQKAQMETGRRKKPIALTVSAAASLKEALTEVKEAYVKRHRGVNIDLNFGGSGALQRQIEQGAPVDLFISAASGQMDALERQGLLLEGTRRDLLSNKVVLIAPGDGVKITGFRDLTGVGIKKIAIGDPATVPCGAYAKQILTNLGIFEGVKNRLVLCKDVAQVLTYVANGSVDAGIVYRTDAKDDGRVRVVETADGSLHDTIIYPVAVIRNGKNPNAAKNFEAFLFGTEAKEIFCKHGFVVPAD